MFLPRSRPPHPRSASFINVSYLPSLPFPSGAATAGSPAHFGAREPNDFAALVNGARAGDPAAQSELVRRYTKRLSAFVRPIISQSSAVEDVVQIIFIKMVRRLGLLRESAAFESWLFTLARNTAIDFIRRRHSLPVTISEEGHFAVSPAADSGRATAEIMEALELALQHLKPKDRILVTMIVQGASYRDAAQRTGVSIGTVKVRLNRVRPFLRASVGEAIGLRPKATKTFRPPSRHRIAA